MRDEIESRPAVLAAIGLIAGVAGRQIWEALAVLAILLLALRTRRALAIAGTCAIVGLAIAPVASEARTVERTPFYGTLEITKVPRLMGARYVSEARNELGYFSLTLPASTPIEVGSEVAVRGTLHPLREALDSRRSSVSGRIVADEGGVKIVSRSRTGAWLGGYVQRRFANFADRSIGKEQSSILQALSFNVVYGLDEEFRRNLQRTGTIHIVSASGAHVMVLAGALVLLLRRLPIQRHWQLLVMLAVLCLYAAAAGFEPPIVRAILMAALGFGAYLFGREPDILSALSIAMIGQLLFNPSSIFDIGVQLSFVTVAAFGMFLGGIPKVGRPLGWLAVAAKASLIATLASAPLTAYYFGQISISSVLANLLIGCLVTPVLVVSLGCYTLSLLMPGGPMEWVMVNTVAPWISAIKAIVDGIGSWEYAALPVPAFSAYWLLVCYGLAVVLWRPRARLA